MNNRLWAFAAALIAASPRLIALLSYDRNPGMVFPEATVRAVLNPSNEPHLGSHPT